MLHKVSDFIKQVRLLNSLADELEQLKYHTVKSEERDYRIEDLISQIKYHALLIHRDNQPYENKKNEDL